MSSDLRAKEGSAASDPAASDPPRSGAGPGGLYQRLRTRVDEALEQLITVVSAPVGAQRLRESMGYSLTAGGKRLRPVLALLGARAVGGEYEQAILPALALECIHTFSLIHDDLPIMDDDDLRRGKATNHKKYDEPTALLAGDALLVKAFEILSTPDAAEQIGADRALRILHEIALATGDSGMCNGQMLDLLAEGTQIPLEDLEQLHHLKTGALIRASVVVGGIAGRGSDENVAALGTFGEAIGLAFQVVDDLLDVSSTTEELGKPVGSDLRNCKSTYVRLLGADGAMTKAADLCRRAKDALTPLGPAAAPLASLANFVIERRS